MYYNTTIAMPVRKSGTLAFPVIHKVGNVVNFVLLRSEG